MKETEQQKFCKLLREFDTAVLITHGEQTHFAARPMAIADLDDNGDLWFITRDDSMKVHEIEQDQRAQVICQKGWASCISIAGHASISRDREEIRRLWKNSYQVWFPRGVEDPEIALIHFSGEEGEYWDNTGVNRLTYSYRALKALATGTTPEITEGEQHGRVPLGR